jgi:hypothetical protein
MAPIIGAAEPDACNNYWLTAAFADSGRAWASDSACFVFILAQMEGATGFNPTLSLHYHAVKIDFKLFLVIL